MAILGKESGFLSSTKYSRVGQDATESRDSVIERELEAFPSHCSTPFKTYLPWALLLLSTCAYIFHTYLLLHEPTPTCFDDDVLRPPIIWEERTFKSNIDGDQYDIYSRDNPAVEEVWEGLLIDSLTAITEDEVHRLPGIQHTAPLYGGEPGYAVITEAFHQLHCLNSIRKEFYSARNQSQTVKGFAEAGGHADHCFSYLVQTLLCHSDVGSMTTRWDEHAQVYHANFNITKRCRNYDVIREWVLDRKPKFEPPS